MPLVIGHFAAKVRWIFKKKGKLLFHWFQAHAGKSRDLLFADLESKIASRCTQSHEWIQQGQKLQIQVYGGWE